MLATDIGEKLKAATHVLESMKVRVRQWNQKAEAKDRLKIMERADEIMTIEMAILSASRDLKPIVISEDFDGAYKRGFETARRRFSPSEHGIVNRRRVEFDNFGSPYNPANEAKRKAHNAGQAEKWEDHY